MVKKDNTQKNLKTQSFLQLAILIAVILVVNLLASQYFKKFDLTKEKRFTLSETTINLAENQKTNLTFNVYLEGDLNPKFKLLQSSLRDLLQEVSALSKGKIKYTFINPFDGKSSDEKEAIFEQLMKKGLTPHYDEQQDETTAQITRLFPGAEVLDGTGGSYILNFLTTELGKAEETAINKSIENLEYEIANLLRKTAKGSNNNKIAFLRGHGELNKAATADLRKELSSYYSIDDVFLNLGQKETIIPIQEALMAEPIPEQAIFKVLFNHIKKYDGLILAKPTQPFSKAESFLLDQYIMHGGKILFLIDPVFAEYDTLSKYESMLASNYDLGELQNMLYIYGIRMNSDLLMDLRCNDIVFQSPNGLLRNFSWTYYPIFTEGVNHPVSKNIEAIWGRFVSTLKPLERDNLAQTPILLSSDRTKMANSPMMLDLGIVTQNNNPKFLQSFNQGNQVVGLLSEGKFQSIFKGRNVEGFTGIEFKDQVENNSMIVIADGDIIKNQIHTKGEGYFELGFDLATKRKFGNKKFIVNCIDYLCDGKGLIDIRNKNYQLRLLDKNKVKVQAKKWQIFNILVPILLIIAFGFFNHWLRKRKYATT